MSFPLFYQFPALGLDPNLCSGVVVTGTDGEVQKVGVVRLPYNRTDNTSMYGDYSSEMVMDLSMTYALGCVVVDGPTYVYAANILWLPTVSSPMPALEDLPSASPVGLLTPNTGRNQGAVSPCVMSNGVGIILAARGPEDPGRFVGIANDSTGAAFSFAITLPDDPNGYGAFYLPRIIETADGRVGFIFQAAYEPDYIPTWYVVYGPSTLAVETIEPVLPGVALSTPDDPRFVGDPEYGLVSSGVGTLTYPIGFNQTNTHVFKIDENTWVAYLFIHVPNDEQDYSTYGADVVTLANGVYTSVRQPIAPADPATMITAAGVQMDTAQTNFWAAVPIPAGAPVKGLFWTDLVYSLEIL